MCCDFRNRDLCLLNPFKGNEASIRTNLASQSVADRSADLIEKRSNSRTILIILLVFIRPTFLIFFVTPISPFRTAAR